MGLRFLSALALAGLTLTLFCAVGLAAAQVPPEGSPSQGNTVGQLSENNSSGAIEGVFISLQAPASGNIVADYALEHVPVFSYVEVQGYAMESKSITGAQLQLKGPGVRLQAHDTASGTVTLRLEAGSFAAFHFAAGVSAAPGVNGSVELTFAGSEVTAAMWSTCGDALSAYDAAARTYSAHAAADCTLNFRARDPQPPSPINTAVESQQVDVEVSIEDGTAGAADVTSYTEATVIVAHVGGRTVVTIQTAQPGPTSVLIRFPTQAGAGSYNVHVDGQAAHSVETVEEALGAVTDSGESRLVVDAGGQGIVVVSLEEQGSHVVEIEQAGSAAAAPAPSWLGIAGALAVTAVAAVLLFRRR